MANLVDWIKERTKESDIVAVVIGEMGWGDFASEGVPGYASQPKGEVLTWEEAKPHLDYEFSDGYGTPRCNAVYVWTRSEVLFVVQYDGPTDMYAIPRHPKDVMPKMPGG